MKKFRCDITIAEYFMLFECIYCYYNRMILGHLIRKSIFTKGDIQCENEAIYSMNTSTIYLMFCATSSGVWR